MRIYARFILCGIAALFTLAAHSEVSSLSNNDDSALAAVSEFPDAPQPQQNTAASSKDSVDNSGVPLSKQQPKRILGMMPNYRAVSAGAIPPPPTPHEAFKIATQNSFDYSSFIFIGITSLLAEGSNAHPALGKGAKGYWGYYWRGALDKTDGNYLVIYALPSILHEDERYFAKGEGPIFKRGIYAASSVLIARNYQERQTFNISELLGRGLAQAVSITYYPSQDRNAEDVAEKYGYAVGRDALTATFREFWPDIATHVLHRHP